MSKKKLMSMQEFDDGIFLASIEAEIDNMPVDLQKMIYEALKYAKNKIDFYFMYQWLSDMEKWRMPKVSLDTFLDSDHYIWVWWQVYPKVREICNDIINWWYNEGIEIAGIWCEIIWTLIRMADWSLKRNDELKVWDYVMWKDWKGRKIMSIHRWVDDMYRVFSERTFDKYVTKEHRMVIRIHHWDHYPWQKVMKADELYQKIKRKHKWSKTYSLIRCPIDYPEMWLNWENPYDYGYLWDWESHIPFELKVNSRINRCMLLAWILDKLATDWVWGCYKIWLAKLSDSAVNDIKEVCWWLWFECYTVPTIHQLFVKPSYIIPVKKHDRKSFKVDWKASYITFDMEYYWIWEYIWFELDWDQMYLWDDYILTHNSWKSFSSEVLACYQAHCLLCMNDAHRSYKLAKDKYIAIVNMGINATQALEVVFTGIKGFIERSPFFQQFRPIINSWQIKFPREKILLYSGNSKSTTPLWYNVFSAVLDEASFYTDNDWKSVAEEIYQTLQRRIVSRFWHDGLLMAISSPRYMEDFTMKKLQEAQEVDENWDRKYKRVFTIQLPTWKVKSPDSFDLVWKFYFDWKRAVILDKPLDEIEKTYKVNTILDTNFDTSYDVWEIPWEFKRDFMQNPEKAKRDFWATPSETLTWFITNLEIISSLYNRQRPNPLHWPWVYKFQERPLQTPYFIHIDIWLNKDWKWDHTGFAMGHFWGWIEDEATWERRARIVIDLMERIWIQTKTWEVDLSDVRRRVYALRDMWFSISMVSFDQFASKDFRQIIEKQWLKTEYVSIDRTIDPYNVLKEAIYEARLDIPYYDIFDKEIRHLELLQGVKVDHPQFWSKDITDAVAWVCYQVISHTNYKSLGFFINPRENLSEQERARKDKENGYAYSQMIVDKRDEIYNKEILERQKQKKPLY